jgi:hypothetical protein
MDGALVFVHKAFNPSLRRVLGLKRRDAPISHARSLTNDFVSGLAQVLWGEFVYDYTNTEFEDCVGNRIAPEGNYRKARCQCFNEDEGSILEAYAREEQSLVIAH